MGVTHVKRATSSDPECQSDENGIDTSKNDQSLKSDKDKLPPVTSEECVDDEVMVNRAHFDKRQRQQLEMDEHADSEIPTKNIVANNRQVFETRK